MHNPSPRVPLKRLVVLMPAEVHADLMDAAERAGDSASGVLRRFAIESVERVRRGEPLLPRLAADTPVTAGG